MLNVCIIFSLNLVGNSLRKVQKVWGDSKPEAQKCQNLGNPTKMNESTFGRLGHDVNRPRRQDPNGMY